ncbi:MAG: DUF58 domain-containing protein [Planctomycetota bacterium]
MLTDSSFIRRLDSLYLLTRKVLSGSLQADRKSTKKGTGITFADYAEYYLGADYRSIDWRVFARFENLVVKLFEVEEDTTIYILLDQSQSMHSKFDYARQLGAALGYIALNCLDRLCVYGISDQLNPILDPCRGRGSVMPFLQGLQGTQTMMGDSQFSNCCRLFQARHHRRSIVIVISDFLFPGGFDDGLSFLQWHKHDVYCLQVQNKNDTQCHLKGDVELQCVETSQRRKITVSPREVRMYESAVQQWNEQLAKTCSRRGIGLASTTPEIPFESIIQDILRRGGLVA